MARKVNKIANLSPFETIVEKHGGLAMLSTIYGYILDRNTYVTG